MIENKREITLKFRNSLKASLLVEVIEKEGKLFFKNNLFKSEVIEKNGIKYYLYVEFLSGEKFVKELDLKLLKTKKIKRLEDELNTINIKGLFIFKKHYDLRKIIIGDFINEELIKDIENIYYSLTDEEIIKVIEKEFDKFIEENE